MTAVDIQAYSESILRGLLNAQPEDLATARSQAFLDCVHEIVERIQDIVRPLLQVEAEAMAAAGEGEPAKLIEIIEFGSLAIHRQRSLVSSSSALANALDASSQALSSSKFSTADLTAVMYFGGPYFAYEQAIVLDAIHLAAKNLNLREQSCICAVMLSTASEIVNTVGKQFAQPMRIQKPDGRTSSLLLKRALRDRTLDVSAMFSNWCAKWQARLPCGAGDHQIVRTDVQSFLDGEHNCDVFYADPPYTIDHYSRFYHVLETLVRRDSPRLDEMRKSGSIIPMRGVYRAGRYQSPFCIPSQSGQAFEQLFAAAARQAVPLVLSYSPFDEEEGQRSRLIPLQGLVELAERHYRKVEVMEISEHSHRKLNAKITNSKIRKDAERLIICER